MMLDIVDFHPVYANAFKQLNYDWINRYFKVEELDRKILENPRRYILDKGGVILMALLNNEPVGTCALMKMNKEKRAYELTKMAVSPPAQGQKIGWMLGNMIIKKGKEMGSEKIYLETHRILEPAINLYKKLGFTEIKGHDSLYSRCNMKMELNLIATGTI